MNSSRGAGDFAGDEDLSPPRAFMIEQDPVRGKHSVRFAVVHGHPMAVYLRRTIRAARMKLCIFVLRRRRRPKHLRRSCLVEAAGDAAAAYGLEYPCRAQTGDVAGELGHIKAYADMA